MSLRIEVNGWVRKGESHHRTLSDIYTPSDIKHALSHCVFASKQGAQEAYLDKNIDLIRRKIVCEISVEDV